MLLFVLTRIGYGACNIFYDSMLVDVTDDSRTDRISSYGYALGYIGSCIPFVIGIALILLRLFGLSTQTATQISFVITALWWVGLTAFPLAKCAANPLLGAQKQSGFSRLFPRGQHLKKDSQKPRLAFLYHRLFLLYRRGVHHHLDGNHLRGRGGNQRFQYDSCPAAHPVCRFSVRTLFGKARRKDWNAESDPRLYLNLLRHLSVWLPVG